MNDRYDPRPESQVREIQHQIEVEAQKERDQLAFIEKVNRATKGESLVWEDGDRQRLEVIEKFILFPEQSSKPAQELLGMLGHSATTENAFKLLVNLGWWSRHENLHLHVSEEASLGFPPRSRMAQRTPRSRMAQRSVCAREWPSAVCDAGLQL